ncbi:MAG: cation diffusion facilitator family transporter [Chloroflexi bacterium]|nr:cation diffusion facilitator family transporter [Chloroflexota bacterium]
MQWVREYTPQPETRRLYMRAMAITLGINILLAVSKGIVAYLSKSVAIYADAANSTSDVLYSLLLILGLWMAQRPPDLSHPQGHNRFEPLVGVLVSISMAFAGYEAARSAIDRFYSGSFAIDPGLPTLILIFSAALKAGMYISIRRIALQLTSPALSVVARDNLSDVLTSVAAFLGAFGSRFLSPLLDPIAGLLVAVWIFRTAFRAGWENLNYLTGGGASEELRNEIAKVASETPGVAQVHHIMTEYAGAKFVIDIHINVDGEISLNQAHAIEDEVSSRLESLPQIDRAYVHAEPAGWEGPK